MTERRTIAEITQRFSVMVGILGLGDGVEFDESESAAEALWAYGRQLLVANSGSLFIKLHLEGAASEAVIVNAKLARALVHSHPAHAKIAPPTRDQIMRGEGRVCSFKPRVFS